jgi:hypothetical protein
MASEAYPGDRLVNPFAVEDLLREGRKHWLWQVLLELCHPKDGCQIAPRGAVACHRHVPGTKCVSFDDPQAP